MRPREAALVDRFREIAEHVSKVAAETGQSVPVIYNGDCFGASDAPRLRERTGASAVMMARAAELNPSCFQLERQCVATVIAPRWMHYAVRFDNPFGNTKYCVTQLAFSTMAGARESGGKRVSPLPKRELIRIRTELSQSRTDEDMARALGLPWPLDTSEALALLRQALDRRVES